MTKDTTLGRFMTGVSRITVGSAGMFGAALVALVFTGSAAWAQTGSVPLGGPLAQPCVVPDDPFESPAVPCLAILQLAEGSTSDQRAAVALGAGAVVRHDFQFANAAAVFVPNELAFWSLVDDRQVLGFIPDRINHLFVRPEGKGKPKDDPTPTETIPSGVARIGATSAWGVSTGSGIGVAIADSGIDLSHVDLSVASACFSVTALITLVGNVYVAGTSDEVFVMSPSCRTKRMPRAIRFHLIQRV